MKNMKIIWNVATKCCAISNALVIHLRGTKENPKSPTDVLAKHKAQIPARKDLKTDLNLKRSQKMKKELEVTNLWKGGAS
jgi:hypothetical protein